MIEADLPLFQDIGLAQLTPEQLTHLKHRYLPFQDQSCVNEILRWLAGEYVFDPDCLTDCHLAGRPIKMPPPLHRGRWHFSFRSPQPKASQTPTNSMSEPAMRFIRVTLPLLARKWRRVRPPLA